jgi:hypothetical protein
MAVMGISISSEELALISVYVAALFLFFPRFSDFDWRLMFLAAATVGVGTGIFVWPWAVIIFGWPGASLGVVVSSAFGLKTGVLPRAGALLSAAAALTMLALGISLLLFVPTKVWRNSRTSRVGQKNKASK